MAHGLSHALLPSGQGMEDKKSIRSNIPRKGSRNKGQKRYISVRRSAKCEQRAGVWTAEGLVSYGAFSCLCREYRSTRYWRLVPVKDMPLGHVYFIVCRHDATCSCW